MKKILLIFLIAPLFISIAYADAEYSEAAEIFGVEDMENYLSKDELAVGVNFKADGNYDINEILGRVWKYAVRTASSEIKSNVRFASELIAIAVAANLGAALCADTAYRNYIGICACSCASILLVGSVDSIVSQTAQALDELSGYSKAALPALFTAAAACGYAASSAAKYAAVTLAIDVMINIAHSVIIPLIYAYIAIVITNSLFSNSLLVYLSKICKWLATTIMTALTIAFSSYIGLTGLVTGTADAAAVRAAKTVISTVLPVVGGILSDASATVLSAAEMVKNSAGIFGLISVCVLCAGPCILLIIKYLILNFAAALADMMPDGKYSKLLSDISGAVGMMLGLLGCCAVMMFVSVTAGIKAVAI